MKKFNLSFFNIHLLKPSNFKLLFNDLFRLNNPIHSNKFHIQKGMDWLILAKKKTYNGGISYGYSLLHGWLPSYPETSGYIIPTLLDYYHESKNIIYLNASREIANWLCLMQLKNGGFKGGTIDKNNPPSIFNTGQIILGLKRAYKEFEKQIYLESIIKAGNFLIRNQEQNGNWIKYCYCNIPHTYNVRTAWALLELFLETDEKKFQKAAMKNLNWALKQKNKNFWFKNNIFFVNENPLLHFISYTIRGFLEAGIIMEDNSLKQVALEASLKLLNYYKKYGILPACFNSNWVSHDFYSCLTGVAQLSIIWLKLYEIYKNKKFLVNAIKLNNYLKSKQVIDNRYKDIDGAIKGSDPIWGTYMNFLFPNWATKFFCDALLLENKIK